MPDACISDRSMKSLHHAQNGAGSILPWLAAGLAGIVAPACALAMIAAAPAPEPRALLEGPILAVALMSVGMICAASAGRLWVGIALALLAGTGLILLSRALGLPPIANPMAVSAGVIVASISFAARGALFARSALDKGWWIAVFVVAGEAAILFTAAALPGKLPDWLLALLPAQWASTALRTALSGSGSGVAMWELLALAGTAAATSLVSALWPRRWPYLIMFGTWLALSALVWQQPA
jgi:hypothetical protein